MKTDSFILLQRGAKVNVSLRSSAALLDVIEVLADPAKNGIKSQHRGRTGK